MRNYWIIFLILVCSISCREINRSGTVTTILMDLANMQDVDLHGDYATQICLMDGDSLALVDDVKKVLFAEGCYIVQGKNKLLSFDVQTGALKTSFSGQGRAVDEFVSLWEVWMDGDIVCLYDMNSKKVLRYDLDGTFLETIQTIEKAEGNPFQTLAKMGKDFYVGKRVYSGMEDVELNLYNKNLEFIKEIGDLKIESGIYLGYPFFVYRPDEVLYYRYLYNDIYSIDDKQHVSVKYYVDFGENNVPFNPNLKDEYDRIDFVNNSRKKYATLVSNIYESEKYFCFRFAYNGEKCLGVYDKASGESASFVFVSSSESPRADVYVFDDTALVVTQDMDRTSLTTIKVDDLLKMIQKIV